MNKDKYFNDARLLTIALAIINVNFMTFIASNHINKTVITALIVTTIISLICMFLSYIIKPLYLNIFELCITIVIIVFGVSIL